MNFESGQKRPISPSALFEKLMEGNFKQLECVDQGARVKEEREILMSLIAEYRQEIAKRIDQGNDIERLIELRARLRVELETLRDQRRKIDRSMAEQIERFKLTPIEIRELSKWKIELEEFQGKNSKLSIRIRELTEYRLKMEQYNLMLEQQRKVIKENNFTMRSSVQQNCGCDGWREKIQNLRKQHENYSMELRNKMREKQQNCLRELHLQEAQIAERNRRRISSFQERFRYPL